MQPTRLDLPTRGTTCASCVARIEQGLRDVPGVAKASVNLATERATLSYDAEQVGVEALVTTIRDLGYDVPPQKLTLSIGGMSCASCVAKVEQGLFGATLNKTGTFCFAATKVCKETALAQIITLVKEAQNSKPPIQKLADKIAGVFVALAGRAAGLIAVADTLKAHASEAVAAFRWLGLEVAMITGDSRRMYSSTDRDVFVASTSARKTGRSQKLGVHWSRSSRGHNIRRTWRCVYLVTRAGFIAPWPSSWA